MKENDFNSVAPIYDRLAKLIFGQTLVNAQLAFTDHIKPHGRVLILGGGTGWFLEALLKKWPKLEVDYVEASEAMIKLSEKRDLPAGRLHFIHGTHEDIPGAKYDLIITHFFLDVFDADSLQATTKHLGNLLAIDGLWLCADFQKTGKWHHRLLLWLMHRFFRITSGLQAPHIQAIPEAIEQQGMCREAFKTWKRGLVFSGLWQKSLT